MGTNQRIIFFLFCVSMAFGQRVPQSLFEPVTVTITQDKRIQELNTLAKKSKEQLEELAILYAATKAYEQSFELFDALAEAYPENFEYQYLLGGIAGILASELPKMKSLPYVRTMKTAFEAAAIIKPDALEVQLILLELYTELPWVLGGSTKKAEKTLKVIKSLSVIEGFLAEGYFYRSNTKNKEALVAYLNAINEIQHCDSSAMQQNISLYRLAVLAFYLQKDVAKAECLFSRYIDNHDAGDAFPKSFARHYLSKMRTLEIADTEMEQTLNTFDKLTFWIQNNFK